MVEIEEARRAEYQAFPGPVRPQLTLIEGGAEVVTAKPHSFNEYAKLLGKKGLFMYLEESDQINASAVPPVHEIEAAVFLHSITKGFKAPSRGTDRVTHCRIDPDEVVATAALEVGYAQKNGASGTLELGELLDPLINNRLNQSTDMLKKVNRETYAYELASGLMFGQDRVLGGVILSRTPEGGATRGVVLAYPLTQETRNLMSVHNHDLGASVNSLAIGILATGMLHRGVPDLAVV